MVVGSPVWVVVAAPCQAWVAAVAASPALEEAWEEAWVVDWVVAWVVWVEDSEEGLEEGWVGDWVGDWVADWVEGWVVWEVEAYPALAPGEEVCPAWAALGVVVLVVGQQAASRIPLEVAVAALTPRIRQHPGLKSLEWSLRTSQLARGSLPTLASAGEWAWLASTTPSPVWAQWRDSHRYVSTLQESLQVSCKGRALIPRLQRASWTVR